MALRAVQSVLSVAAAFVAFEGLDTRNLPLAIGALVAIAIVSLAISLIQMANARERRRAGLPRPASATFGVALAFILLDFVGSAGAGAVVWATDTCTMQVGSHNANITLTGFFSKAVCQNVEASSQNQKAGFLADVVQGVAKFVDTATGTGFAGAVAGELGSVQFHDGSPGGNTVCTGWYREARWVVVTVRDLGDFDRYGNAMCKSLNSQGLLASPWDR